MRLKRVVRLYSAALALLFLVVVVPGVALGATEQAKRLAINKGLAYLAGSMTTSGSEGYWSYVNNGTLAATASAALAFIEEGFLPGQNVIIDVDGAGPGLPVNYGNVVGKAANYIFNRATADGRFTSVGPGGKETAGYTRYAEDYNNNGILDDGGNNQAIFFSPSSASRNVYTTGIVAPVVRALGQALGPNTVVGRGSVTGTMTYRQVMQDVMDWYSWGQVEPNMGSYRGGWRYDANSPESDNSTAQWGALPILYANAWGLGVPQYVKTELEMWTNVVQNANGGSGYTNTGDYVNVSKTGGLMLEFAAIGYDVSNTDVQAAMGFINSRWNTGPSGTWYGNLNQPYAMWAIYKAMEVYGFSAMDNNGTPLDPADDFLIGFGMGNAPGGLTIGQDWDPKTSLPGDWYSHYCDYLVSIQNTTTGGWAGYSYWTGALATGWYINILNAAGAPPPVTDIPEPLTLAGLGLGLGCLAGYIRRRRGRS